MTDQEIFALMDRFERSSLQAMKLSTGDLTLELSRGSVPQATAPVVAPVMAAEAVAPVRKESPAITAPLVGTFYAAPAPDQPPFVAVGDKVAKGQTVCLMEAMKMMSEIPAPCDCVIEEVDKASGELAAFGDVLFRYTPC